MRDILKKLRELFVAWGAETLLASALGVLAALGLSSKLWGVAWGWLVANPEPSRRVCFVLVVALILLWRVVPRRGMRLAVEPYSPPGPTALVLVTLRGARVGSMQCRILAMELAGKPLKFQPYALIPAWADSSRGPEHWLRLATLHEPSDRFGTKEAKLSLENPRHEDRQDWQITRNQRATVRIRLTLTPAVKPWFRQLLPAPRPYSAEFLIVASSTDVFVEEVPKEGRRGRLLRLPRPVPAKPSPTPSSPPPATPPDSRAS